MFHTVRNARFVILSLLVVAGGALPNRAWAEEGETEPLAATSALAVLDLEARGATPVQAHAVTMAIVRGLRQLDVFTVLSAEDVRQLLALERSRQLLGGGGDGDAMDALREALGARFVVAGTVTALGADLQVEMRLLDSQTNKVLSEKSVGPAKVTLLARDVPGMAQTLVAPLLEGQQGQLLVRVSEEAAEVRVDDVLRGSTPMQEPLVLARGTHRLEVRKDGFIAQLRPVRVEPAQLAVEEVRLAPSPDYADAYKARHRRSRVGAWLLSGVAVGALGGAVFMDRSVERRYQEEFLPMQSALLGTGGDGYLGNARVRYDQCLSDGRAGCTATFNGTSSAIRRDQGLTMGLLGVGLAAGGVATYLWLTGEDPNRYSRLVAAPSFGNGTGFALTGGF